MLPTPCATPIPHSLFPHARNTQVLWDAAPEYLAALQEGADKGLLDLSIIDTFSYEESLTRAITQAMAGGDARQALEDAAEEWDEITDEIGIEDQRAAYQDWAAKPGAYPN